MTEKTNNQVFRYAGRTVVRFGNVQVVTDRISRHWFNRLRKMRCVTVDDFFKAVRLRRER